MLSIRLKRIGQRHKPFYRLVVSDSRNRPGGKNVEEVGYYDPKLEPSLVHLEMNRVDYWLSVGAKPSRQVNNLIAIARKAPQTEEQPG